MGLGDGVDVVDDDDRPGGHDHGDLLDALQRLQKLLDQGNLRRAANPQHVEVALLTPPPLRRHLSSLSLSLFACLCPLSFYKPEEARTRTRVRRTQQQKQSWRADQPVLGWFQVQIKRKEKNEFSKFSSPSHLPPPQHIHSLKPPKPRSTQEEQDAGKTTQESLYQESSAAVAGGGGGESKKRLAARIGDRRRRRRRWRGGVFIKDSGGGDTGHASTRCGR